MICKKIEDCKEKLNKPRDTFVDKIGCKSQYLIENKGRKTYYKVNFESCVYSDRANDTKCDYGMITGESVFFIELKGSDVKKGITQLLSTIKEVKNCFEGKSFEARLIVSKTPKPNLLKKTKEYRDLVKITNQRTIIKKDQHTDKI